MKEETIIWINKANEDFRAVELLLQFIDSPAAILCFHCQQAAEKYLKAYLVDREIEFPRTHDLLLLLDEFILKIDASFIEIKDNAETLNEFAIISRYPGSDDVIDLQVARDAFKAVTLIRMFILERIGKD